MNTSTLTANIMALLGTEKVSTFADFGTTMYGATHGDKAIENIKGKLSCEIIRRAKAYIAKAGDIPAASRKELLVAEMNTIHRKSVKGWLETLEYPITDLPDWPTPRTDKDTGETKPGYQNKGSYLSFTAPEIGDPPSIDNIVPGSSWRSCVSSLGSLWELTDNETVQKVVRSKDGKNPEQGLAQALEAARPAKPAKPAEKDTTDHGLFMSLVGSVMAEYDFTGQTLVADADALLAIRDALAMTVAALELPKKVANS